MSSGRTKSDPMKMRTRCPDISFKHNAVSYLNAGSGLRDAPFANVGRVSPSPVSVENAVGCQKDIPIVQTTANRLASLAINESQCKLGLPQSLLHLRLRI